MRKKNKSLPRRLFNSIGSLALIGSGGYLLFSGINLIASSVLITAFVLIIVPIATDGGSIFEIVAGIFEAIIDGLVSLVEAVMSVFSF